MVLFLAGKACCIALIRESFLEQSEATSWWQGTAVNNLDFLKVECYIIKVYLTITKTSQHIKKVFAIIFRV